MTRLRSPVRPRARARTRTYARCGETRGCDGAGYVADRRALRKERADAVGAVDPLDRLAEKTRERELLDLAARSRRRRKRDRVADDDFRERRLFDARKGGPGEDSVRSDGDDRARPLVAQGPSGAAERARGVDD